MIKDYIEFVTCAYNEDSEEFSNACDELYEEFTFLPEWEIIEELLYCEDGTKVTSEDIPMEIIIKLMGLGYIMKVQPIGCPDAEAWYEFDPLRYRYFESLRTA